MLRYLLKCNVSQVKKKPATRPSPMERERAAAKKLAAKKTEIAIKNYSSPYSFAPEKRKKDNYMHPPGRVVGASAMQLTARYAFLLFSY